MIYGYIRVSSDKQTVENQRYELNNFAAKRNIIAEGVILGRPKGSTSTRKKLTGREHIIKEYLAAGKSYNFIARQLNVHRLTVSAFIKSNKL